MNMINDNNEYAKIGDTITFNDVYRGFGIRKMTGIITGITKVDYLGGNEYLYFVKCGKVNRSFYHTGLIKK